MSRTDVAQPYHQIIFTNNRYPLSYKPYYECQMQENNRPMDWQDKVVIYPSVIVILVSLFMLIWERT
jgi:hypothetical protein